MDFEDRWTVLRGAKRGDKVVPLEITGNWLRIEVPHYGAKYLPIMNGDTVLFIESATTLVTPLFL